VHIKFIYSALSLYFLDLLLLRFFARPAVIYDT